MIRRERGIILGEIVVLRADGCQGKVGNATDKALSRWVACSFSQVFSNKTCALHFRQSKFSLTFNGFMNLLQPL